MVGQETPVMTALSPSGCTGIGAVQPGSWADVLDGAGEVLTAPVLALATGEVSGAVSRAA